MLRRIRGLLVFVYKLPHFADFCLVSAASETFSTSCQAIVTLAQYSTSVKKVFQSVKISLLRVTCKIGIAPTEGAAQHLQYDLIRGSLDKHGG